jgi:caa(3)-type oxidase subunit IV
MTQHHSTPEGAVAHHTPHAPHVNYKRIYIILLVLLGISIMGPRFGIKWLTLITAFGIAIVKANLVVQNFMHLRWEQKIMKWALLASIVIVALFYAAVRPDVGAHYGRNWVNDAAQAAVARGIPAPHEGGEAEPAGEHPAPAGETPAAAAPAAESTATAAPAAAAAGSFNAAATFTQLCQTCHGPQGAGNGPMAASLNPKPANFASAAFWTGKTDAELVKAIREGGAAVHRSAAMPAWGAMMNESQAQAMVAYLHTLKH